MNFATFAVIMFSTLLVVSGALWMIFRRRRLHWGFFVAGSGPLIFLFVSIFFCPLVIWGIDALTGWELRLPVEANRYKVTLVQQPGSDFYKSYFEVMRTDGKKASVWIDGDDDRWWSANIVRIGGKIYFVRDSGKVEKNTPFFDLETKSVSTGHTSSTLAALEYK